MVWTLVTSCDNQQLVSIFIFDGVTVKTENQPWRNQMIWTGCVNKTRKSKKTTQKHLVTRYVHSNGCFNVGIFTDLSNSQQGLSSPLPRFRGSFRYQSRAPCCTGEVFRSFSVTRKNIIFEKMPSSSLLLFQSPTHQSSYKAIALHPRVYPYLSHQTLIGKTQASLR